MLSDGTGPGSPFTAVPSFRKIRSFFLALIAFFLAVNLPAPGCILADENVIPSPDPVAGGPMTFSECVRTALKQSPYFVTSSLEMDLKRLDETDSKFALFPSLSIRTRYYFDYPNSANSDVRPYSLGFVTDEYNPVEAYISIKARKLISQIAVFGHMRTISESIQRIAAGFLELQALNDIAGYQKELTDVAEQSVAYVTSRIGTGGATALDSRLAGQESATARFDSAKIETSKATILDGLKSLLGIPADQVLELDLNDARTQVLDRFEPASATLDQVRANSCDLKIENLKKELQAINITLSYTKFLPTLSMRLETADPLSGLPSNSYYFSLGFEMPIWDGLKRSRNISRQKTMLHQVEAEEKIKEIDTGSKWKDALEKLSGSAAELKLAVTQEELAGLKLQQTEIGYQSGRLPFSNVLAEKKARLEALKNTRIKKMEHDKALLNLRFLCGELSKVFVDAKPLQN